MSDSPTILWFRQDLRLADNPALAAAVARGAPIIPLYVLDDETPGEWRPGRASRWWLHESLEALSKDLEALGLSLVLRSGVAGRVLEEISGQVGAGAVMWNRCYEPFAIKRDKAIKSLLTGLGIEVNSSNGALLVEPWKVLNKSGAPFKVFSPFWKTVVANVEIDPPLPPPSGPLKSYSGAVSTDALPQWVLQPTSPDWAGGLRENWTPGEAGAAARLYEFLNSGFENYADGRDLPDKDYTSRLSPHLHWGEISPRQIWAALHAFDPSDKNTIKFRAELGWREFSYHLLYQAPQLPQAPLRPEFAAFPWAEDEVLLRAWQRGETGIPLVDAGMRQLWHAGWMHNRVRMVAASFLVKHLLQPWQAGETWFWDTLVDADLASNSASWQWVAGCGADAAPYFRVFNPALQGKKFDTSGEYVRTWVPELRDVPDKFVHGPWEMDQPPADYPAPVIKLAEGRERALQAYEEIKRG